MNVTIEEEEKGATRSAEKRATKGAKNKVKNKNSVKENRWKKKKILEEESLKKEKVLEKNSVKKKGTTRGTVEIVERHVREVLMELMASSASDSVRVAAAKALMDKLGKDGDDECTRGARKKRLAAVREAERLLEEIAEGKSGRFDFQGQVDQDGSAGAADPNG